MRVLQHGRVADTSRLREVWGYQPKYTSVEAFDDFVRGRALDRIYTPEQVAAVEATVLDTLARRRTVDA
jgi:UDP-glucose 4-epimerase